MLALLFTSCVAAGQKTGAGVRVVKTGEEYRLLRNGKPFFIRGVGGREALDRLAAAGANSIRTWGADNLQPLLDEAQKRGLAVTVGIWLGHERHGFNYGDAARVAAQREQVKQTILRYKDHPAVLMWGLGNEMEGKGDNPAIWTAVNDLARMAKELDPSHPTITVIAEMGGDKVRTLHRLCPDIDVVGINSYAGAASLPERYRRQGGVKPYVLTEFGPPGSWEVGKKPWGAAIEPSSTEKSAIYRRSYEKAVKDQPLCLGSYAFLWGHKQEATATWFGMLLPDRSKLGAVDTLAELWSGKPSANRCPVIGALRLEGPDQVDPGATLRTSLDASDPEGDPLLVEWVVQPEADQYRGGGDAEPVLPTFPEVVIRADMRGAEIRAPRKPGGYRIFAYVRDGKGGAAVANVPFLVEDASVMETPAAKLPLRLDPEQGEPPYTPSGWMGTVAAIKMDPASSTRPRSGKTCVRCDYTAAGDWGGVVWQHPANDWGDKPGGWNLGGAKQLAFWARGEKGGEVVTFQLGLLGRDKRFFDTAQAKLETVKLTSDWKEYRLDVAGKDLRRIKTGFAWVVAGQGVPVTFYLDDIRYE